MILNGHTSLYFDLVGGNYVARGSAKEMLVRDWTENELVVIDAQGSIFHFYDFTTAVPAVLQGQLKSLEDSKNSDHTTIARNKGG